MRLTVLGSGTLLPDDDRRSAAHFVEAGDARLLLDCGAGTVHGFDRHGIPWHTLTHLFVTHFHTDHVGDLPALLFALKHGVRPPRDEELLIGGPEGTRALLGGLAAVHGEWVLEPGFPVRIVEFDRRSPSTWKDPEARFEIAWHPTPHTEESIAFRIAAEGRAVGYTGDTGPDGSGGLGRFFRGVDVLVSECSVPDGFEPGEGGAPHLTPGGVARLAGDAEPELLLLTHLFPYLAPDEVPRQVRSAGFAGSVRTAWDGTEVEVGAGGPRVTRDPRNDGVGA